MHPVSFSIALVRSSAAFLHKKDKYKADALLVNPTHYAVRQIRSHVYAIPGALLNTLVDHNYTLRGPFP